MRAAPKPESRPGDPWAPVAGDVVYLASGGPALTVDRVDEDMAVCLWIGEDGELHEAAFALVCLRWEERRP